MGVLMERLMTMTRQESVLPITPISTSAANTVVMAIWAAKDVVYIVMVCLWKDMVFENVKIHL